MKFKILRFINSNPNWRTILSSSPYNLIIKDLGDCTLIKYNQLFSDFKEPMVREARGIIIQKKVVNIGLYASPSLNSFVLVTLMLKETYIS